METMDSSNVHGLLIPDEDEGSVDIYAGLDAPSGTLEKSPAHASPRLKESMDLYEEMVTEEQQSRESSYNELKSRYQAAQIQIQELRKRLEQMETQNTGLNTENFRLKKNISALLRTARQEVTRKDEEIQRLNQRSGKSRHHFSSHTNGLWDPYSSMRSSTSKPPPPPPPPSPPPPLPPSPPKVDCPPWKPPQPSREKRPCGSSIETRTPNPSSSSINHPKCSSQGDLKVSDTENSNTASSSSSSRHGEASKHREERHQTQKLSDPSDRRHKVDFPPNKPPQPSREERGEVTRQPGETRTLNPASSSSSSNGDCKMSDTEKYANGNSSSRQGEADKHKESKHREEKHQSQKPSDPSERRHRSDSSSNKDIHVSEKNRSHKADKDTRRRYDSRSGKSRHHPDEEPHQRSERSTSPPPPENKGRSRERRQDKAGLSSSDRPERRTSAHSWKQGHGRDDKKPKTEEEHVRPKRSGSREQKQTSSKEHGGLTSQEKRKEERRSEDDPGRWDKRCGEGETQRSKESDQSSKEGEETTVASERSSEPAERSSVEENSPNRKLCFMETLNLTLSPVKKALLPADVSQEDLTPAGGSEEEGSLPDVEDMCVIDEVDSSELQDECDEDVDASVAKSSVDILKAQRSDETNQRRDGQEVEDDKIQSESAAAEKQREDDRVQTTSEHLQPAESLRTPSPEEEDAKGSGDQTKSTSDGEALDSGNVTDTQRSIEKPDTKTSSHEADCASEERDDVTERGELDSTVEVDQSAAQRSSAGAAEGAAALESKEPSAPQHVHANAAAESERLPQQEPQPSDGSTSNHQRDQRDHQQDHQRDGQRDQRDSQRDQRDHQRDQQDHRDGQRDQRDGQRDQRDHQRDQRDGQRDQQDHQRDQQDHRDGQRDQRDGQRDQRDGQRDQRDQQDHQRDQRDGQRDQRDGQRDQRDQQDHQRDQQDYRDGQRDQRDGQRDQQDHQRDQRDQRDQQRDQRDGQRDADAVSSTMSSESFLHETLSLRDAVYVLTQTNEDASDGAAEPSSSFSCSDVSKVSSTTEETKLPDKFAVTPKKMFSPGKRQTGREERSGEPSSSVLLLHDEDSMMRTLSGLKSIPDAISPLRSPARLMKRNQPYGHEKPGHVKSLRRDFFGTSAEADSVKLDVNKENKYPGSPAKLESQTPMVKASEPPSDNDLEEGEILSESDDAAAASPLPSTKRATSARAVRNLPSPKATSKVSKKKREYEIGETAAGASSRSPSNKSRFKTVCPAASKAAFSTTEEVMETFKMVRSEIRKKFMKLHKSFPRKSFYGMMDNFQKSFLEFVDAAQFDQICSQAGELRAKLKKLVASVFNKVSNNGIVKRIFEQQAGDLKQKLWDFVDVQVDYLFMDIHKVLKELCKPAVTRAEEQKTVEHQKLPRRPQCQQKVDQSASCSRNRISSPPAASHQTGLGLRGKDIRMSQAGRERDAEPPPSTLPNRPGVLEAPPPQNIPSTPEKSSAASLVVSQSSSSLLDKSDFEILTEQQTSSLTFNLVRDSQMGEIFKCLLQGSDLLESGGLAGENSSWSLSTPRKDGESLVSMATPTKYDSPSKLLSPTKFQTPSKLLTTWSSISPCKTSPRSKDQVSLNPALFDESCLLEVPSESRVMLQASQRTYSILAEDLAVSLTIPSPLKSDSHLSFLQPPTVSIVSTPDSVISAHISEDALLDEEDATEQDIHLALDTDNSTCGSSSSVTSEAAVRPFHFKPDVPMQAVVMERSNDHFVVKIRQAATGADATLIADEILSQTLTEDQHQREENISVLQSPSTSISSGRTLKSSRPSTTADQSSDQLRSEQPLSSADVCFNQTLVEEFQRQEKPDASARQRTTKSILSEEPQRGTSSSKHASSDNITHDAESPDGSSATRSEAVVDSDVSQEDQRHKPNSATPQSPSEDVCAPKIISPSPRHLHNLPESSTTKQRSPHVSDSREETEATESERSLNITEDRSGSADKHQRKRKKRQDDSKAKRRRKVEEERESSDTKQKKKAGAKSSSAPESPNSLSAKNVVRKKGEVVMAWTRDEDRSILLELKTHGASRQTFSALSEKLEKPSAQIAERFYQLMKLFKKQEKMET